MERAHETDMRKEGCLPNTETVSAILGILNGLPRTAMRSNVPRSSSLGLYAIRLSAFKITKERASPKKFRYATPAASRRELNALLRCLDDPQSFLATDPLHGPAIWALAKHGVIRADMTPSPPTLRKRIVAARDMFKPGQKGPFDDDSSKEARSKKPSDNHTRALIRCAAEVYEEITGNEPKRSVKEVELTYRTTQQVSGPFYRFITQIFKALGIRASAAYWAAPSTWQRAD